MSVETELQEALRPRLTYDGLRNLIQDCRSSSRGVPSLILLNEYDRREVNQEFLAASVAPVAKEDQRPEHDLAAISIVEGVPIGSHPDVKRGSAKLCYPPPAKG